LFTPFLQSNFILKKNQNISSLKASFNILRVGMRYKLVNYGEVFTFEVIEILGNENCLVRSIDTLETYQLQDLVKFGKGDDFDFEEL